MRVQERYSLLRLSGFTMLALLVNGCSSMPVVPPCPPCVDAPDPQHDTSPFYADMPHPYCESIKEHSYVYCSEPTTLTFSNTGRADLAAASAFQYANLTAASIGTPECFDARMDHHPTCTAAIPSADEPYRRGEQICLMFQHQYDAAHPDGSETTHRLKIWERYLTKEACTSNPHCAGNWAWFINRYGLSEEGTRTVIPGHDPQILLAPREVFIKLTRPHAYWCEPGPILASCPNSDASLNGTNVDPNTVAVSESSCSPGLAAIAGTFQAAGAGMGGGSAVLGAIARGMNLDTGATLAAEQERQRSIGHDSNSSAATAVKKDGGSLGSSGAGSSNLGSSNAATAGGSAASPGGASPTGGNGVATATSGGGGLAGGENSDSSAALASAGKTKDEEVNVVGSGDYDSAAGGGGRGGQKGGGFGGLGGGSAPTVAGVSDVAFSKGGPGGPANPLAGLGGAMNDQEFERLLQKNSERSLFEIANRRYFQWGGSVMSGEAKDTMKKITP